LAFGLGDAATVLVQFRHRIRWGNRNGRGWTAGRQCALPAVMIEAWQCDKPSVFWQRPIRLALWEISSYPLAGPFATLAFAIITTNTIHSGKFLFSRSTPVAISVAQARQICTQAELDLVLQSTTRQIGSLDSKQLRSAIRRA